MGKTLAISPQNVNTYIALSLATLIDISIIPSTLFVELFITTIKKRMTELETKKLYVKNLDWNLTEEQVKDYFSQFGEIASIKLPLDKFKRRRGFAFVEYVNEDDAQKALSEANGKAIDGTEREMSVEMARAEDPEEREARYAARRNNFGGNDYNKFDEDNE